MALSPFTSTLSIFLQAEYGIRDHCVTGVQTCALPIYARAGDAQKKDMEKKLGLPGAELAKIGRASRRESVLPGAATQGRVLHVQETCRRLPAGCRRRPREPPPRHEGCGRPARRPPPAP